MIQIDAVVGALANIKNPALTGFTGHMQDAAVAAVDDQLEGYAVRFETQMVRLGRAINHICDMAGIAGVGALTIPPGQSLETRFGLTNIYLAAIDTMTGTLAGHLNSESDHDMTHLDSAGVKASSIFNEAVNMGYSVDVFLDAWIAILHA